MHKSTDNMKDLNVHLLWLLVCFLFKNFKHFVCWYIHWHVFNVRSRFFLNICLCCLENVVEQISSNEDEDVAKIEEISGKIKMRIRTESRIFLAQMGDKRSKHDWSECTCELIS